MDMEWIVDQLYFRFILNLPQEELEPERLGFNIQEAHWYYIDYMRESDPTLPHVNERELIALFFRFKPFLFQDLTLQQFMHQYNKYLREIKVCGAVLLNSAMDSVVLASPYNSKKSYNFPKGKIDQGETEVECACREVWEEIGYSIPPEEIESRSLNTQGKFTLFIVKNVPDNYEFETQTVKEIGEIKWFLIEDVLAQSKKKGEISYVALSIMKQVKKWIRRHRKKVSQIQSEKEAENIEKLRPYRSINFFRIMTRLESMICS